MERLRALHFTFDMAERAGLAEDVIEVIPDSIVQSGYDKIEIKTATEEHVVMRTGALDVFFQVVHGLPDTIFIQYGFTFQPIDGSRVDRPVGERELSEFDLYSSPPQLMAARISISAVETVANSAIDRYDSSMRIRDGAVLEPVLVEALA